jgi:bacteriocin biosynthesis cyclodehydratase domain-containing protein
MTRREVTLNDDPEAGDARDSGRLADEGGLARSEPGQPRLPRLPRLKQTIEVVAPGNGNLYLLRPGGDADLMIGDAGEAEARFLASLDGTRELPPDADLGAIRELVELGLVEDAADDDVLSERQRGRLDRQLRYLSDLAPPGQGRAGYQERLARSTVAVLGVGGLGSWAALALACVGIGRLVVVDADAVEESNFNRQVLFEEADLGALKVEAAARRLRAFDSALDVVASAEELASPEDVGRVIAGADIVVDAADRPAHLIERWVDAACFERGIPYITMSHFPPVARIGPLYVPGRTACFACLEAQMREAFPLFDAVVAARTARPSPAGTFGPACALIGGWVAADVTHHLSGIAEPSTLGRAHIVDLRSMSVTIDALPAHLGCERCSPGASRAGGR